MREALTRRDILAASLAAAACTALLAVRLSASARPHKEHKKEKTRRTAKTVEAEVEGERRPSQQPQRDKGRARLEWWQRLNEVKPALTLPSVRGRDELAAGGPAAYCAVAKMVADRMDKGRDWLVRDSDYRIDGPPAHSAVKVKVNSAIVQLVLDTFGGSSGLVHELADPHRILLLLDTPNYGSLRELAAAVPHLQRCQQVVIPQADLRHYFEMIRGNEFYVGVRAQRVDHWLCANASHGLECLVTFLDYECRLAGARSARLCPAADIMRYFRFGYPADPCSVLAITVGLEEPASTPEEVDTFVRWEASLNGYEAELKQSWKYRMVTLLYTVRRLPS